MALSRISNSSDLLTSLSRISHAANASLGEMQCTRYAAVHQNRMKNLHVTSVRRYPDPPVLPLPTNVSEIFANETGRFTPERSRDIAAPVFLYAKDHGKSFLSERSVQSIERSSIPATCKDTHVDSYDCFGAVSLNGSMQSNVPKPFCSSGKSMHLNMPGGQWARDGKYIAEDMQKSHYRSIRFPQLKWDKSGSANHIVATNSLLQAMYRPKYVFNMGYTTNAPQQSKSAGNTDNNQQNALNLSKKERFKILVQEYGVVVVVFHIGISLISLGAVYAAVIRLVLYNNLHGLQRLHIKYIGTLSLRYIILIVVKYVCKNNTDFSGLDLKPLISTIILDTDQQIENLLAGSSAFVVAYAIHKVFVPIRFGITLTVVPFLVRYLRKVGILKYPKVKAAEK